METIGITYKTKGGTTYHRHKPHMFASRALADDVQPIRIPVSYKGQHHLPGYFWMSRMRSMVAYESRLEMTILLQFDFNQTVTHVISQPFVLHYMDQSRPYRHIPDFFIRYDNGAAEVVNVKPRQFINTEKNIRAFHACEQAAIEMGWAYSTRSEINAVYLANLKWLAAYRRPPVDLRKYSPGLIDIAREPVAISAAIKTIDALPALVRPVLFHMIWTRALSVDLHARMTEETMICATGRAREAGAWA